MWFFRNKKESCICRGFDSIVPKHCKPRQLTGAELTSDRSVTKIRLPVGHYFILLGNNEDRVEIRDEDEKKEKE